MDLRPYKFYIMNHQGAIMKIDTNNIKNPFIKVLQPEWVNDVPELAKITDADSLKFFLKSRVPSKSNKKLQKFMVNDNVNNNSNNDSNNYDEWDLLKKYKGKMYKDPIWIKFID